MLKRIPMQRSCIWPFYESLYAQNKPRLDSINIYPVSQWKTDLIIEIKRRIKTIKGYKNRIIQNTSDYIKEIEKLHKITIEKPYNAIAKYE